MGAVGGRPLWQALLGVIIVVAVIALVVWGIYSWLSGREEEPAVPKPKAEKVTIEMVEPASGTAVLGAVSTIKFKSSAIVDPGKLKIEVSGAKGVVSGSGTEFIWTPSMPLIITKPQVYEVVVKGKGVKEANFWFEIEKPEEPKITPPTPPTPKPSDRKAILDELEKKYPVPQSR